MPRALPSELLTKFEHETNCHWASGMQTLRANSLVSHPLCLIDDLFRKEINNPWNHGPHGIQKLVAITAIRRPRGPMVLRFFRTFARFPLSRAFGQTVAIMVQLKTTLLEQSRQECVAKLPFRIPLRPKFAETIVM